MQFCLIYKRSIYRDELYANGFLRLPKSLRLRKSGKATSCLKVHRRRLKNPPSGDRLLAEDKPMWLQVTSGSTCDMSRRDLIPLRGTSLESGGLRFKS